MMKMANTDVSARMNITTFRCAVNLLAVFQPVKKMKSVLNQVVPFSVGAKMATVSHLVTQRMFAQNLLKKNVKRTMLSVSQIRR